MHILYTHQDHWDISASWLISTSNPVCTKPDSSSSSHPQSYSLFLLLLRHKARVTFDSFLSPVFYIQKLSHFVQSSSFWQSHNLPLLSLHTTRALNYRNDLPPVSFSFCQSVLQFVVNVIVLKYSFEHIIPLFTSPWWFPLAYQIKSKAVHSGAGGVVGDSAGRVI